MMWSSLLVRDLLTETRRSCECHDFFDSHMLSMASMVEVGLETVGSMVPGDVAARLPPGVIVS